MLIPPPDVADVEAEKPLPDIMHEALMAAAALPSHTEHARSNDSDSDSSIMDDIPEVDEPVDSQGMAHFQTPLLALQYRTKAAL